MMSKTLPSPYRKKKYYIVSQELKDYCWWKNITPNGKKQKQSGQHSILELLYPSTEQTQKSGDQFLIYPANGGGFFAVDQVGQIQNREGCFDTLLITGTEFQYRAKATAGNNTANAESRKGH